MERNGYVLDGGCGLAICEALEAFPDTVRRKFNGGLPEALFRVSRDHLSKRLNVVLMDATEAVTIKGEDILAGMQRLRQTMGEETKGRSNQTRQTNVVQRTNGPKPGGGQSADQGQGGGSETNLDQGQRQGERVGKGAAVGKEASVDHASIEIASVQPHDRVDGGGANGGGANGMLPPGVGVGEVGGVDMEALRNMAEFGLDMQRRMARLEALVEKFAPAAPDQGSF